MFGNYFFPLFFVSKKFFPLLRLKNSFDNQKWTEKKIYFQFVKKPENMQKIVFSFYFLKVNENTYLS